MPVFFTFLNTKIW